VTERNNSRRRDDNIEEGDVMDSEASGTELITMAAHQTRGYNSASRFTSPAAPPPPVSAKIASPMHSTHATKQQQESLPTPAVMQPHLTASSNSKTMDVDSDDEYSEE
jgi:hypothetical protein